MVDFHDRRTARVESVDDIRDRLPLGEGDTLGKHVIGERYVVVGHRTEQGRAFQTYEALPNGGIVPRGEAQARRKHADRLAEGLQPTSTYKV